MRQGTEAVNAVREAAVAYDMSSILPSANRDTTWPALTVETETNATFSAAGTTTTTFTVTASPNNVRTDSCTTTTIVLDGLRTENDGSCPGDVTYEASAGRLDHTHIWTVPGGWQSSHASGSNFRLGRTVVYMWSSSVYCSFVVTVTMRKF